MTTVSSETPSGGALNKENEPSSSKPTVNNSEQVESTQEIRPKRKVFIITAPAGEVPQPLPSWTEVGTPPSIDDTEERAKWEKK